MQVPTLVRSEFAADPTADARYFRWADGTVADGDEVREDLVLDYEAAGRVLGIDVLGVSKRADDPRAKANELVRRWRVGKRELGTSYLSITHNIGVVEYIADDVVVMNKGRVEEAGPAAQVLAHPRSAYTQTLLAAVPRVAVAAAR